MRRAYLWGGTAAVFAAVAHQTLWRVRPLRAVPAARLSADFDEALAAVRQLQAEDGRETREKLHDVCRTRLWSHGSRTPQVFVLLHGYTNCPHQFNEFGDRLYQAGHSVLAPRLPYHGQATLVPTDLQRMTAEDAVVLTCRALDAAHGLGEHVTLLGFSFGGVLAAWAAQNRADADRVALVAPALGLRRVSRRSRPLAANMLWLRPDRFRWWNPVLKAARKGPPHAYAGFSTRALAQLVRLAVLVEQQARRRAPATGEAIIVTNPCDEILENGQAHTLATLWREHGARVSEHHLPEDLQLIHDCMDPTQPLQKIDSVYPMLLDLLLQKTPTETASDTAADAIDDRQGQAHQGT